MTMTFEQACHIICREACDTHTGNVPYAVAYARAGLSMSDPEAQRVQALYIVGNLSHWRHPEAKAVRSFLKEFGRA